MLKSSWAPAQNIFPRHYHLRAKALSPGPTIIHLHRLKPVAIDMRTPSCIFERSESSTSAPASPSIASTFRWWDDSPPMILYGL